LIQWASSDKAVASIADPTSGLVTTGTAGTTTISLTFANADGTAALGSAPLVVTATTGTGPAEPIVSMTVSPASQTASAAGQTIQFLALATTGTGSTVNLTGQSATINNQIIAPAVWLSSNSSVAKIVDQATGSFVTTGPGAAIISATVANPDGSSVTGQANVTVAGTTTTSAEPYVSLAIVPAAQTLYAVGQTASFLAIGTTATGATADLTSYATWSSSNVSVAKLTGTHGGETAGQFQAVSNGVTAIVANVANSSLPGGLSTDTTSETATVPLTVATTGNSEPLLSIAIVPGSQSVSAPGQSSQLLAIGTFSAAPITQDVTNGLATPPVTTTWSSSDTSVATVTTDCPTGLTALSCTISACPGASAAGVCTSCPSGTVAVPAGPSCATLNPTTPAGLVTGVNQGAAAIVVVSKNTGDGSLVTTTAPFSVTGGTTEQVTALQIIPAALGVTSSGQQNQFLALATEADGHQYDVTANVTWESETPSVATICSQNDPLPCTPDTDGLATAGNPGTTTIKAIYQNTDNSLVVAQASYTLTIGASPEPLISINVVPPSVQVSNKGMTQQYLAFGTFTTIPTVRDITDTVTWITLDPNIASINSAGSLGEAAGIATAMGEEGTGIIYAEDTTSNPDGTLVLSNPVTFICDLPNSNPPTCVQTAVLSLLTTLTVFNAGSNNTNWLITAPSDDTPPVPNLIHCGPGSVIAGLGNSVCTGTYAAGSAVTITASLAGAPLDSTFGGWTANCDTDIAPVTPDLASTCAFPNAATPTGLFGNQSAGALFYGLTLSCSATTSGTVGAPFTSGAIAVGNGTGPYTFSVVGTLPAGLTLDTATGAVTGTPTAAGSFSITAADKNGTTAETPCPITISN
jgi:hypothetical protein